MTVTAPTHSHLRVTPERDGWNVQAHRIDTYPIHLADGAIHRLPDLLAPVVDRHRSPGIVVAADAAVADTHLPEVISALTRTGLPIATTVIPSGEAGKSLDGLQRIWRELHDARTTRRTLLVGVGGGVVCDLITAAAAVYMRGLPYALVPTTVLAQLDAAIGGKGGVDWAQTKNLLGAFHHPAVVVIDPALTATLPARQIRNGLAEAIKVALIADPDLFADLEAECDRLTEPGRLTGVLRAAIDAKLALLAADPFEVGDLRRTLNLGHCIGHPLEAATGYRMLHGEAVATGIAIAAAVAHRTGRSDRAQRDRIVLLLTEFGLPTTLPAHLVEAVWAGMDDIRRIRNDALHFVLPIRPGHCVTVDDVSRPVFDAALADLTQWTATS